MPVEHFALIIRDYSSPRRAIDQTMLIRLIAKTAIRRRIPVTDRRCSVGVPLDDGGESIRLAT